MGPMCRLIRGDTFLPSPNLGGGNSRRFQDRLLVTKLRIMESFCDYSRDFTYPVARFRGATSDGLFVS